MPIKWSPACHCCVEATICCGTPLFDNPGDLSAAEWTPSTNVEYVSAAGVDRGLLRATAAGELDLAITHDPYLFDSTSIQYTVCAVVRYESASNLPWARLKVGFAADSPEVFFNIAPGGGYWWSPDNTLIDCAKIEAVPQQIWGLDDWILIQFQFRAKAVDNGDVELRWTRTTQDLTPTVAIGDGNRVREISLAVECPPCGDKLFICTSTGGELPQNNTRCYLEYLDHGDPEAGSNVDRTDGCDYKPDPIGSAPLDLGLGNVTFDGGSGGDIFWFWTDNPAAFNTCQQTTVNPPSAQDRDYAIVAAYCDDVPSAKQYRLGFDLVNGNPAPDPVGPTVFQGALFQDENGDYWVPENQLIRLPWSTATFPDGYALVRFVDETPV